MGRSLIPTVPDGSMMDAMACRLDEHRDNIIILDEHMLLFNFSPCRYGSFLYVND
jgi:hypothetical protein